MLLISFVSLTVMFAITVLALIDDPKPNFIAGATLLTLVGIPLWYISLLLFN
jgi:hypothetical protein